MKWKADIRKAADSSDPRYFSARKIKKMAVAVELTHVTKAFDTTLAVNDVSLKIEKANFSSFSDPPDAENQPFSESSPGSTNPTPANYDSMIPS